MYWALSVALLVVGADPAPERTARIHDIRFLTAAIPHFPAGTWPEAGRLVLGGGREPADPLDDWARPGAATLSFEVGSSVTPGMGLHPEQLVGLIRRNIAEDTWENSQNAIVASEDELTVVHTSRVHEAISAFLSRLRELRALIVRVDVGVVPHSTVVALRDGETVWLRDGGFEEAIAQATDTGTFVSLAAYNEQTVSAFSGEAKSALVDSEVNQTGVLPVVNPVIDRVPLGVTVEALPRALLGSDLFSVDLQVERLREVGEVRTLRTFFADMQLQEYEENSLRTTLVLAPGRTVIAGTLASSEGADDFAVILRVIPHGPGVRAGEAMRTSAQALPEPEFTRRVHDVGFLTAGDERVPPHTTGPLLVSMIEYNIAPESWRDERASVRFDESRSALAVVARAETHASVLAFLKERTEQAARLGVVEIWEVEGPLESVDALITSTPRERATLLERRVAEDPLEQRVYAFVVGVVGTPVRLDGYRARSFLGAVEVASGGTGFAVLECPDPIIESSGDGVRIQAQVDSTPLEALVRLDLAFGRYSSTLERSARFVTGGAIGPGRLPPSVLPEGNAVAKLGAADDRGARQVWIPWQVELPSQHKSGVTLKQVVEPGLPHVLRVASAPGGRARVILSRTRYSPAGKEESDR